MNRDLGTYSSENEEKLDLTPYCTCILKCKKGAHLVSDGYLHCYLILTVCTVCVFCMTLIVYWDRGIVGPSKNWR